MKKIILIMIVITLISTGILSSSAKTSVFTDVEDNAWYGEAVNIMANNSMIFGVSNNKYNPIGKVTRAEYMALILRIFEGKDLETSENAKSWMDKYIKKAEELKLVAKQDEKFWTSPIPRDEVAHYMNSLFKFDNEKNDIYLQDAKRMLDQITLFKDVEGNKYKKDINAVAGVIMVGEKSNDKEATDYFFRPDRNLSRAEIAMIVFTLHNYKKDKEIYNSNITINHTKLNATKYHLLHIVYPDESNKENGYDYVNDKFGYAISLPKDIKDKVVYEEWSNHTLILLKSIIYSKYESYGNLISLSSYSKLKYPTRKEFDKAIENGPDQIYIGETKDFYIAGMLPDSGWTEVDETITKEYLEVYDTIFKKKGLTFIDFKKQ